MKGLSVDTQTTYVKFFTLHPIFYFIYIIILLLQYTFLLFCVASHVANPLTRVKGEIFVVTYLSDNDLTVSP